MQEIKTEDLCEDFSSDKEISDFSNHSTKSKYCDDSDKVVIGKTKDETGGVVHSFLVGNIEYKKANDVNKNVLATIIHNKYKDVLSDNKLI